MPFYKPFYTIESIIIKFKPPHYRMGCTLTCLCMIIKMTYSFIINALGISLSKIMK